MKRTLAALLALAALVAAVGIALASCSRTVSVQSGERYVCRYGHPIGEDIQTLQVPASDARKYRVETKTITCEKHKRAELLYGQAQQALGKGDVKTAEKNLAEIVKLDPAFRRAKSQLDTIKQGKKPDPDLASNPTTESPVVPPPSSGTTEKPKPPSGGSGAMDAWRDIVPDQITGFRAEALSVEELTLSRDYVPGDTSQYDQLAIQVQRYSTPREAEQAIASVIVPSYPGSAKKGAKAAGLNGYFGVNGQKYAVLSLVNGEVLVSLELHATGASPAGLYDDLQRIAEEVLD